jgi:hypothetical protein
VSTIKPNPIISIVSAKHSRVISECHDKSCLIWANSVIRHKEILHIKHSFNATGWINLILKGCIHRGDLLIWSVNAIKYDQNVESNCVGDGICICPSEGAWVKTIVSVVFNECRDCSSWGVKNNQSGVRRSWCHWESVSKLTVSIVSKIIKGRCHRACVSLISYRTLWAGTNCIILTVTKKIKLNRGRSSISSSSCLNIQDKGSSVTRYWIITSFIAW